MTKHVIQGRDGYVDHFGQLLRFYREMRGKTVDATGSIIPLTTHDDVKQTAMWWYDEYLRHNRRRSHDHPVHAEWTAAVNRIRDETKGADPKAVYPNNKWFWFSAIKNLALHLESERTTPTQMELIIESVQEAVDDRIDDVKTVLDTAGNAAGAVASTVKDAADAVTHTGERLWSGLKIAAIVGAGLLGAAIVVPPIIRAFRD